MWHESLGSKEGKVKVEGGEYVFEEGERGDHFYVIVHGGIELRKATGEGFKKLAVLRAGQAFGEMALLNQTPRSASALAVDDTYLLSVSRAAFSRMLGGDTLSVRLLKNLSKALWATSVRLASQQRATSADGDTVDSTVDEYRGTYLRISLAVLEIGKHVGPGTPAGSQRIKIDNTKASASVTTVFDTASAASEIGLPGVRLLAAHADADFFIRGGRAGVGFALDEPGETSTVGDINVSGNGLAYVGDGVTLTNFYQGGGTGVLQAAATVALVDVDGGTLTTEGDFTVTAMNVQGGTVNANHAKTSGNAITTATVSGGTLDGSGSRQARTWNAVNINGGSVVADNAVVTMTTLNQPAGPRTISVS